jgi:hypothetical protein
MVEVRVGIVKQFVSGSRVRCLPGVVNWFDGGVAAKLREDQRFVCPGDLVVLENGLLLRTARQQ